jgi:sugar lactone lactonase YvrE
MVTILLTLMLMLTSIAVSSVWTDLRRAPRAERVLESRTAADAVFNALFGQATGQGLLPQIGGGGALSFSIPGVAALASSPQPTNLTTWATYDAAAGRFATCPDLRTTCFRYAVDVERLPGRERPVVAVEVITRSGCVTGASATCVYRRFQQRWKQREFIDYLVYNDSGTDPVYGGYDTATFQLSRPDQTIVTEGYAPATTSLVTNAGFEPAAPAGYEVSTLRAWTTGSFTYPYDVVADPSGNLYVTDAHRIRKISPAGVVTTFAGSGTAGGTDGTGTAASFNGLHDITIDAAGTLYVTEYWGHRIRKISPAGVVTTFAGSGTAGSTDGTGTAASFSGPTGIAIDATGTLYVTEYDGHRVRRITPAGVVTTLAGSGTAGFADATGTAARFNTPHDVAVDGTGNAFVADRENHRIRRITPAGVVTTYAGTGTPGGADGTATTATFNGPNGVAIDPSGNLIVTEQYGNRVRRITPAGVVTTLAGSGTAAYVDGTGTAASFNEPAHPWVDSAGNILMGDINNRRIRRISPTGVVTTVAGTGVNAFADSAPYTFPTASYRSVYDTAGNLFVQTDHQITRITPAGIATPFAGSGTAGFADGTGTAASFSSPRGLAIDAAGNLYVADASNHRIRRITPAGVVTTLAGSGTAGSTDGTGTAATFNGPIDLAVDATGTVFVADSSNHRIRRITPTGVVTTLAGSGTAGSTDGTGTAATFNSPRGIALGPGGIMYVADTAGQRIRAVTPAGVVTTLAGSGTAGGTDGTGTAATFSGPTQIAVDRAGLLYVADQAGNRIRRITAEGQVTTIAGTGTAGNADGPGLSATFTVSAGVTIRPADGALIIGQQAALRIVAPAVTTSTLASGLNYATAVERDAAGNLYVAELGNHRILKVTPSGTVTTLAGSGVPGGTDGVGTNASFDRPTGLALDATGTLFVSESAGNRIRKVTPDGAVTTFAGTGTAGAANGVGTAASFHTPHHLVFDRSGNLYVADAANNRIRRITPDGTVTTFAGTGTAGGTDGPAATATFHYPSGLAFDAAGNLFVADSWGHRIRRISPSGWVTTVAGTGGIGRLDGPGVTAQISNPIGLAFDRAGTLFIADYAYHSVRTMSPDGMVATIAGTGSPGSADGTGTAASFNHTHDVLPTDDGTVYVLDLGSLRVMRPGTALPVPDTPSSVPGTLTAPAAVGAWTVEAGTVDLFDKDRVAALSSGVSGVQALDLNGTNSGTIAQTLPLRAGGSYLLSFRYTGNINLTCGVSPVGARITAGSLDTTLTTSSTTWARAVYPFTATTDSPVLRFASTNTGCGGLVLDDVRILDTSPAVATPRRYHPNATEGLGELDTATPAWRAATQFRLTTNGTLEINAGADEASLTRWRVTRTTGLAGPWTWATSNTFTVPDVAAGDIVALETTALNDDPTTRSLTWEARRNGGTWFELRSNLAGNLGIENKTVELSRTGDVLAGRVRTNSASLRICGGPRFNSTVELANSAMGDAYLAADTATCPVQPVGNGTTAAPAASRVQVLPLPLSTATFASTSASIATTLTGPVTIVLAGPTLTMTPTTGVAAGTSSIVDVPAGRAVRVEGDLTISGNTDAAVTFYATGTITVAGDLTPTTASRTNVDLGLVAEGAITVAYDPTYRRIDANLMSRNGNLVVSGWDTAPIPLTGPPILALTGTLVTKTASTTGAQSAGIPTTGMISHFRYPSTIPNPPAYLEDIIGNWERLDLTEVPPGNAGLLDVLPR